MSKKILAPSELGERAPQKKNKFGEKSDIMLGSRKSPDVPGRVWMSPKGEGAQKHEKIQKTSPNIKK